MPILNQAAGDRYKENVLTEERAYDRARGHGRHRRYGAGVEMNTVSVEI